LPLLFIAILCLPLIEIAMLVMVGSKIGVLATLGLVIFTGFLGSALLRLQGVSALSKLRREMAAGRAPDKQLADAAMIVFAGILLIIPGFISDVAGIILFIPLVRRWIIKLLAGRVKVMRPASRYDETVVDLETSQYHRTQNDDEQDSDKKTTSWQLPSGKQ
jgi:UPF0716 protein FxsA